MVKRTQTIRKLLPTNCLGVFDHFVGLALKEINGVIKKYVTKFKVLPAKSYQSKTTPYVISDGRISNTRNLTHALSALCSFKKSKEKNILPLQFFADISTFNKNTVFFVIFVLYLFIVDIR